MEEKDISTEEVKQLLTNFFKEEGYYLIRENIAQLIRKIIYPYYSKQVTEME